MILFSCLYNYCTMFVFLSPETYEILAFLFNLLKEIIKYLLS